jgi:hypothetical protein
VVTTVRSQADKMKPLMVDSIHTASAEQRRILAMSSCVELVLKTPCSHRLVLSNALRNLSRCISKSRPYVLLYWNSTITPTPFALVKVHYLSGLGQGYEIDIYGQHLEIRGIQYSLNNGFNIVSCII